MEDKVQLIKEWIENLKNQSHTIPNLGINAFAGFQLACDDIIAFINSLPEEPASKDLEEELDNFLKDSVFCKLINRNAGIVLASHFAEWGRNHIEDKSEMISEDLEEATSKYVREDFHERSRADFKAGVEWQRKKDQQTIELAEDHAMLAGMEKMREKMMKDAVDAFVNTYENTDDSNYVEFVTEQSPYKFKELEKCKLIIIKEKQQ